MTLYHIYIHNTEQVAVEDSWCLEVGTHGPRGLHSLQSEVSRVFLWKHRGLGLAGRVGHPRRTDGIGGHHGHGPKPDERRGLRALRLRTRRPGCHPHPAPAASQRCVGAAEALQTQQLGCRPQRRTGTQWPARTRGELGGATKSAGGRGGDFKLTRLFWGNQMKDSFFNLQFACLL